ncbi:conserved hypothetical protein [Shewanella sediminis HAW-EB3]|uniref:DUF3157 domain-containing protein n=1 Tax=Shewanella sediminis (strain HAW-EB3) TaxID=425104 RepID=A8G1S3_SHESH|nr:DUF3157 family protein [Shewanella sediminis]ABV39046.1 conserved hypothetical protein [Shewanella sediminis HAW-EB3]
MHKLLRVYTSLALLIFTVPVMADEVAKITLENGATVRLNDDFTWEYVILKTQEPVVAPTATTQTGSEVSSAATVATVTTTSTVANALTESAMENSALLNHTAKSGVKVRLLKSEWDADNRLGLTFDLASTSSENYVVIELDITLFDDSGKQLKTETVKVWKAIFRMANTYLRNGEQRQSKTFWIEGIDKSQWTKELMSLKIGEMDSRM